MRKYYSEPELEIRKYRIAEEIFTISDPDLNDDDEYELGGEGIDVSGYFG